MKAFELKHLYCAVILLAAFRASCLLAETTEAPHVEFTVKPTDLFEFFKVREPSIAPVFNCQISGVTEEMEVVWMRNDVAISEGEYISKNYTLMRNDTNGDYNLNISRNITIADDRDKYCCGIWFIGNTSDNSHEQILMRKMCARLRIYYLPVRNYPQCSISVTSSAGANKVGQGFSLECCMESWNRHIEFSWQRNRNVVPIAGMNVTRRSEKDQDIKKCLIHDVNDHQDGDSYQCLVIISPILLKKAKKQLQKLEYQNSLERRLCVFRERSILLERQDDDATFSCYSPGANYVWSFTPTLDKNRNQYHMSDDGSTVLLNLDTLSEKEYNITCTAVSEDSIGSSSVIVEIGPSESAMQNIFRIVAISLGAVVVLFFALLIFYFVKTKLLVVCGESHSRNLTPQEMRARIQIRRNMAGNSAGLYAFPSSRMASSSITPLMEGPEEGAISAEPSSPKPPRPGLITRDTSHLEGAVGGVILDEDDMIECEYRDEFEPDPKNMNVEGLQYADLEFSSDEEEYNVETGEGQEEEAEVGDTNGNNQGEKPKTNYADIVHFDPRKNSDPRRKSTGT